MKKMILPILAFLTIFSCQLSGQNGSTELVYCTNSKDWYARQKGVTKYLIQLLYNNKPEVAIEQANKQGADAEACFIKALAYAKLERIDSAMHYVHKSLELGLPIVRYQGLKGIIKPLMDIPHFKKFIESKGGILVHGPMIGYTTSNSSKIWLRTSENANVQVILSTTSDFKDVIKSSLKSTNEETEFVAKVDVKKLLPSTQYYYKLKINNTVLDEVYSFTTQPNEGEPGEVSIAFGGGAAYIPWHSYMWDILNSHQINVMLLLGDNVYIDYPTYPDIQRYCYHQRQSKPEFRNFASGTSILSIWDDHDFGENDQCGGPQKDFPTWKPTVLSVFKNQFVNPYYGGGEEDPGIWYDFKLADIDFFMLDCRYYREPSNVEVNKDPQMLGPVQMEWLKNKLLASKGTFKVIVSSVVWADGAVPESGKPYDSWRGYTKERKEIFDFLADNKIDGVVLMSADKHRSELRKIKRDNGYSLYEMESSKLINTATHACMNDADQIFCYNEKCSFGKIFFNTKVEDPKLTFEIWNIDNEKINEYTIKLSELKH